MNESLTSLSIGTVVTLKSHPETYFTIGQIYTDWSGVEQAQCFSITYDQIEKYDLPLHVLTKVAVPNKKKSKTKSRRLRTWTK